MNKFCKERGISRSTFRRLLNSGGIVKPLVRPISLPNATEQCLLEYCVYRADFGFGFDWTQLQKYAKKLGEAVGLTDFQAGNGWMQKFRQRHGSVLSRRRCQIMEFKRCKSMNKNLGDDIGRCFHAHPHEKP